jgi:hypothetical protein
VTLVLWSVNGEVGPPNRRPFQIPAPCAKPLCPFALAVFPLMRSLVSRSALRGLMTLRPVLPGRCAVAVSYLYDNLLDLRSAYPGEGWQPLRRLTQKQPSLNPCAPKATRRTAYVS